MRRRCTRIRTVPGTVMCRRIAKKLSVSVSLRPYDSAKHCMYDLLMTLLWLVVAALLFFDTLFAYKRPIWVLLLWGGVVAGVLVDAGMKLWECDACEHGVPTVLVGVALGAQIALMAAVPGVPASNDYKKLQSGQESRFP